MVCYLDAVSMSNNLIANRHDTAPKARETDTKGIVNTTRVTAPY